MNEKVGAWIYRVGFFAKNMALLYILRFFKSAFKFLCLIYKTFLVCTYITKDPFFKKNAYDKTASMHNNMM